MSPDSELILARLNEIENDVTGANDLDVFAAVRSVLEGCDLAEDPTSSVWVYPEHVRTWIAEALGVEL